MGGRIAVSVAAGKGARAILGAIVAVVFGAGCIHAPNPNGPPVHGSVGFPQEGVLVGGEPLAKEGRGYAMLRDNGIRYGIPRFTALLTRTFATVADARPGGRFRVGDLSAPHGGRLLPRHASHRTGRDVDILFPLTTMDGSPIDSPGFLPIRADGTTEDKAAKRTLRFDTSRAWALVNTLLHDDDGAVQWIFCAKPVRARLLAYATAAGADSETLRRAARALHEPSGAPHDDHFHVRIACNRNDVANGCIPYGPPRSWHLAIPEPGEETAGTEDLGPLVRSLFEPLVTPDKVK
jgi:penicillin-insensitive murein endopeptidase